MSHDVNAIEALFALPFNDLLFRAHTVHRVHFDPNRVQRSTLLSIKTGGCSEDCGYCSQSARFDTAVEREPLLPLADVVAAAQAAKERGATRFCMGAAWRGPKDKDLDAVIDMVRAVKALGLETCVTLGQLRDGQAEKLKAAGLDYYNHNLDTSRAHYGNIVHTHSYDDRLGTLRRVRDAGLNVCCGGILGMGESRRDRAAFLAELAALDPAPESVPLNMLVKVPGTPLGEAPASREAATGILPVEALALPGASQGSHNESCGDATVASRARPPEAMTPEGTKKPTSSNTLDGYAPVVPQLEPLEFVRTIAVARIVMPGSYVRLSAGRQEMPDHLQALCFFAGANSIFYGDKLLTTPNPESDRDQSLFESLGIKPEPVVAAIDAPAARVVNS